MCERSFTLSFPTDPQIIGDHLKKRRYELGLRQKDVAAQLQINEFTMSGWENNKKVPGVRYIPRIIEFLGYDPFPAPQSLAERLLATRRSLGLSRQRMARRLSVDEATLARWEKGEARPAGGRLRRAEAFLTTSPPSVRSGDR